MSNDQQALYSMAAAARPTLSIRARLVLLAAIAIAPLLFDRIRLLEADRAERIGAAYEDVLGLARRGIEAQQELIVAARSVLQVASRANATLVTSEQSCFRLLTEVASDVPWIKGLSVLGINGRVTCSTLPNAVGVDLSDRPYFQEVIRTGSFVLSNYVISRSQGIPTLVAVFPTRSSDLATTGVITAGIDLRWFRRLADVVSQRPGGILRVIDGTGVVLASYPEVNTSARIQVASSPTTRLECGLTCEDTNSGQIAGARPTDDPLLRAMGDRDEGRAIIKGADSVRRIFGFMRLPGSNARIAIGLDESEVLRRINREIWIGYGQLGLVCALILFGIWFGANQFIVQPINALARSASRIGYGNLGQRLSQRSWAVEFAPLAGAFDEMAHKLAVRDRELQTANEHLQKLANRDELSGLANRRSFDMHLEREWRRAAQTGRPLAMLMIDVDHFKLFNDHYGHVEGDACLRSLGSVLTSATQDGSSIAARYGGEEFAVLLPGADTDTAVAFAERLRTTVSELGISHIANSASHVTISVGASSCMPQLAEPAQVLVKVADAALYSAKRRGRNTVVAHGMIAVCAS
ncbi:MAG TPA: diguanylate cyclase [Xanthobacteraceae bacterium]|jgi:diguanylate cyclase (GGDEF)-like protein|nr:diguanylate cyclase [Xanthobacteraceae bacterium]